MKSAVLIIDMINDFVTGRFENERAQKIVPNIKKLLETARSEKIPIIYVRDAHPEDDSEFDIWGPHAVAGSEGSEVIPELESGEGEPVLDKTKYSAFFNTNLNSILENLEVEEVVLTGVLTDICIQHTAADAFFRGYKVIIPRECVDSLSDEENKRAIKFIEKMYGAEISNLKDLLEKMEA
ncbi:nicotinamidase [candidate division MSBL1 archaeon SCGC-AAA261O19]|uniref:Nicotinamidase n=2 Tax=candidate division MSBL1 TaxID=215777 RepID=A0A133V2H7_9EURY|nr:nicotinamidase [candidate division MSBL1 archaeon SCGC-AAA261C02]KXB03691.1 nicotinamidase [candidate division MSBL1 archaeon SCGC-AAA261O19]